MNLLAVRIKPEDVATAPKELAPWWTYRDTQIRLGVTILAVVLALIIGYFFWRQRNVK